MLTIEEMRKKKKEMGFSNAQLSELSGVPLGTVQKIFSGATKTPRHEAISALSKVLEPTGGQSMLYENTVPYISKRGGPYTISDIEDLPDDIRAELIDGFIYDMGTPATAHQMIVDFISTEIRLHIRKNRGNCLAFSTGLGVQLDCDNKTFVIPDITVVCNRDKLSRKWLSGAPDFAAEVLSPSSRKKDTVVKLNKYMEAGVGEYWIIDPDKLKILVYRFDDDDFCPQIFGFDAVVPITCLPGDFAVDFREVYEYIRFLYEDEEGR